MQEEKEGLGTPRGMTVKGWRSRCLWGQGDQRLEEDGGGKVRGWRGKRGRGSDLRVGQEGWGGGIRLEGEA